MRYQFLDFELDDDLLELRQAGVAVHVEPQILRLLALLVRCAGRTLTKTEINEEVWSGRVVSDAALSGRIKALRQLLGDDGKRQEAIRTVHRRGFRFVTPVVTVAEPAPGAAVGAADAEVVVPAHPSATPSKPTIAVLPFQNLSADPDQDYFSDGVSADLISHLSKHRWLNVVARNTAFAHKHSSLSAGELGKALSARYVVEGSVQKSNQQIRVRVDLIDTDTGFQMWSERYDRELSDIFHVQDDITETIAARLEPAIGFSERNRVIANRPDNLKAWDCFHLGVYQFFQFTAAANLEAQSLLKRSFELDPRFGEAWAWWAYAVVLGMVYWDLEASMELLDDALAACETALQLDPHNATFYALRARTLLARKEYDRAIVANQRAIELNPTFAAAHCGLGDSLAYEGRYEEAISCFERAIALSPNDPQNWAFYSYGALALIFHGDYERAATWTERALATPNCQFWARAHRAVALAYLNETAQARRCIAEIEQEVEGFTIAYARARMFYLKRQDQLDCYEEGLRRAGAKP